MYQLHIYSTGFKSFVKKQFLPSVCYVLVSDENGLTYRHSFFTIQ